MLRALRKDRDSESATRKTRREERGLKSAVLRVRFEGREVSTYCVKPFYRKLRLFIFAAKLKMPILMEKIHEINVLFPRGLKFSGATKTMDGPATLYIPLR